MGLTMAQFKFLFLLVYWYQKSDIFEFEWDSGNQKKSSTKHHVSPDEVESVFELKLAVPIGRQISPISQEVRFCILGPTATGRMLSVVFVIRSGKVRPISGRPVSRKERNLYEEISQTIKGL